MADDSINNGVPVENINDGVEESEDFFDSENQEAELTRKIEALEKEKRQILHENEKIKGKVENMASEIDGLKKDKADMNDRLEAMKLETEAEKEGKSVMHSIAARAAELETEVSRLQHDLVLAMTEGEDSNAKITVLQRTLDEKVERILYLEKEVEEFKKAKGNSEKYIRELEKKIGVLEVRESELKSEKIRVKEEMREKVDEKEVELAGQRKKVDDLESVIAKNGKELQKFIKEKNSAEEALQLSEENVRALESMMVHVQNKVGKLENTLSTLKEKTLESVNGIAAREIISDQKGETEVQWPMVALGSTGVVVAVAAMAFVFYSRQR